MSPIRTIFMALVLFPASAYAADFFSCDRVATLDDGHHEIRTDSHVTFSLSGDKVKAQLMLSPDEADKEMTFKKCAKTKQDYSDFSKWFELECRRMESSDGSPVSIKKYLKGAYAGISPAVNPAYSMWPALSATSKEIGMARPDRTFVLYSINGAPIYEFFCHQEQEL